MIRWEGATIGPIRSGIGGDRAKREPDDERKGRRRQKRQAGKISMDFEKKITQ